MIKDLEQAHFTLALEAPGYRSDDIHTAQIYATALGGGMSSRLFQEIRERRGLCYTIYAQVGAFDDTGMLTIYAGTSGEQIGGACRPDAGGVAPLRRRHERGRTGARARPDEGGASHGARKPLGPGGAQCAARGDLGQGAAARGEPSLVSTRSRCRGLRDHAGALVASGRAAMALYGPVGDAPDLVRVRERLAA